MKRITKRTELVELGAKLGVRPDWHEPDEQGLTAKVYGDSFDNAMPPAHWYSTAGEDGAPRAEMHVVLYQDDEAYESGRKPVAAINLATLLAWASGLDN